MPLFAIWDDLYDDYYETNHAVPQFSNEKQAESYLENLKKEVADREAAEWLKVEHAEFLADKDEPEPSDEELDELPISTVIDGEVQTFPDAAALDKAVNAEPESEPVGNFHITDEHLGEGGAKQKYARNIDINVASHLSRFNIEASRRHQFSVMSYLNINIPKASSLPICFRRLTDLYIKVIRNSQIFCNDSQLLICKAISLGYFICWVVPFTDVGASGINYSICIIPRPILKLFIEHCIVLNTILIVRLTRMPVCISCAGSMPIVTY